MHIKIAILANAIILVVLGILLVVQNIIYPDLSVYGLTFLGIGIVLPLFLTRPVEVTQKRKFTKNDSKRVKKVHRGKSL